MTILDTNVLSALMSRTPPGEVVGWLDRQARTSIWTTSVSITEIRFRLQVLREGKRRAGLMRAFELVLSDKIAGRIAPFDTEAARHAGDLMAARHKHGRPRDLRDTMIAGIVLARHATLATRNVSDFADLGVTVVNPWED